jgi:hypothetical protein
VNIIVDSSPQEHYARLDDMPEVWAYGRTVSEAIGTMVSRHPSAFGVERLVFSDQPPPKRETAQDRRHELSARYKTRNIGLAINRAIREELGRGDALDELDRFGLASKGTPADKTRLAELIAEKNRLIAEVRKLYGLPVNK